MKTQPLLTSMTGLSTSVNSSRYIWLADGTREEMINYNLKTIDRILTDSSRVTACFQSANS